MPMRSPTIYMCAFGVRQEQCSDLSNPFILNRVVKIGENIHDYSKYCSLY
jgi:hypothetical protein